LDGFGTFGQIAKQWPAEPQQLSTIQAKPVGQSELVVQVPNSQLLSAMQSGPPSSVVSPTMKQPQVPKSQPALGPVVLPVQKPCVQVPVTQDPVTAPGQSASLWQLMALQVPPPAAHSVPVGNVHKVCAQPPLQVPKFLSEQFPSTAVQVVADTQTLPPAVETQVNPVLQQPAVALVVAPGQPNWPVGQQTVLVHTLGLAQQIGAAFVPQIDDVVGTQLPLHRKVPVGQAQTLGAPGTAVHTMPLVQPQVAVAPVPQT
jgi:hypothetical protein